MNDRNFITNERENTVATPNTVTDIRVKCRDCNEEFVITPEEQLWFKEKNYDLPRRCPACRKIRRRIEGAYQSGKKKALMELRERMNVMEGAD